jgi:hypothetical protein
MPVPRKAVEPQAKSRPERQIPERRRSDRRAPRLSTAADHFLGMHLNHLELLQANDGEHHAQLRLLWLPT